MKRWMTMIITLIVGLVVFTSGCSQGASIEEYQRVVVDNQLKENQLKAAQANISKLENEISTLKQQMAELQKEKQNLESEVEKLKQTSTPTPSTSTPTQPPSSSVIVVTHDQLEADYDANKLAADIKYKDKILRVTGKISSLGGSTSEPMIYFKGKIFISQSVRAILKPEYANDVANMVEGQTVTVQGLFKGMGFLWNDMVNCELVP